MKRPNKLAIDGDIIAYRAAAAVEKSTVVVTHIKSKREKEFSNRTEFYGHHAKKAGGWLAEENKRREEEGKPPFLVSDFSIADKYDSQPVENACQVAKQMVKGICASAGISSYQIILGGEGNFRKDIATIVEYKGNRKDQRKPEHLYAVREYLLRYHPSKEVTGMEADDALAILAAKGEAIQATIDKDAYQVGGWIFDWDKMEKPFEVKQGVGKLWIDKAGKIRGYGFKQLMWQMLVGDKDDNILPRKLCKTSFGEKGAYTLLESLKTEEECLQAVLEKYKAWYPEEIGYHHWKSELALEELGDKAQSGCVEPDIIYKDYLGIASEIFSLLYMLRDENDNRTFEKLLQVHGVDYE